MKAYAQNNNSVSISLSHSFPGQWYPSSLCLQGPLVQCLKLFISSDSSRLQRAVREQEASWNLEL